MKKFAILFVTIIILFATGCAVGVYNPKTGDTQLMGVFPVATPAYPATAVAPYPYYSYPCYYPYPYYYGYGWHYRHWRRW